MEHNGSPKPEFETDEERSYFITRLFVHEGFLENGKENVAQGVAWDVAQEKGAIKNIIERMIKEDGKVTRKEIAEKAHVSIKTIERQLKKMDHIRYIGSGCNGHWEIKSEKAFKIY